MANLFSLVLFICGLLSIVIFILDTDYWINLYTGFIFWAVALFNAALEFWQVYSSAKTLEGFLSLVPSNVLVIRNGQMTEIPAIDVVVGDLITLKTGNRVPADARIIWSDNVRVDNSSLTGESEPQERDSKVAKGDPLEARNLLFSGTSMISGEAMGIVVRVGSATVIGRLAQYAVMAPKRTSQLEHEMTIVIHRLVLVAFVLGVLALVLALSLGLFVNDSLEAAVGIFVSFLPQGLPATMTILLTSAARRMAKRNVLVKELRSVETLGAMTLLATDKTGTLTQNLMAVVGGWIFGKIYNSVEELDAAFAELSEFFKALAICTLCKLDATEADVSIDTRAIYGDATEVGLLRYFGKFTNLDAFFPKYPKMCEIPFTSATKWHAVVVPSTLVPAQAQVILKGAPERVLERCASMRRGGESRAMSASDRREFTRMYQYFASKGLRILGLATKQLDPPSYPVDYVFERDPPNFPLEDLEFLGFICLRDPPKPGVHWAVSELKRAGVLVTMVTGDHPLTAEAISRQVGIVTEVEVFRRPPTLADLDARPHVKAAILLGEDVETMASGEWRRVADLKEVVFARTAPRHKLEIVRQMQAAGHIVAVSGDGVNDSPALRKANLGISMNKTASDVSKDAAHLILLDDNFVSVVAGVFEGRLIFENVKKSIRYTFTHITAEVSAMLLYALLLIPPPLSPILLIFIDVFGEIGPAVSFAGEPAEYDLMTLPPRHRVRRLLSQDRRIMRTLQRYHISGRIGLVISKIVSVFYLPDVGEKLVDRDLVFWSFLEGGVIVALGAWGAYILALVAEGVPLDILYRSALIYFHENSPPLTLTNGSEATAAEQMRILGRVQAAFFLAILIAQWFNVFVQKHRYGLPFGWDMFVNKLTYLGIFFSMVVAAIVVFIPGLNAIFQTNIPPALAIGPPIAAGIFLLVYETIRRSLRHRGHFGGIPSPLVLKRLDRAHFVEAPPAPRGRELSVMEPPVL